MSESADLAVVGAGISGLAAAWEGLRRGARVMVLDAAPESGGKLRTSPFAGVALGYLLGVSPVLTALLAAVAGAVGIEWLRSRRRTARAWACGGNAARSS